MIGFQIKRRRHSGTKELLGWQVYLPHSCDEWEISSKEDTYPQAVQNLKDFIAEAQAALDYLEEAAMDWEGHYGPDISMRFEDSL